MFWSALHGVAALHLARKQADFDRVLNETVRALGQAYRSGGRAGEDWQPLAREATLNGRSGIGHLPAE